MANILEQFHKHLDGFVQLKPEKLYGQDFLLTWEKTLEDLKVIVKVAQILRFLRNNNISPKVYDSGLAISIFRDKSTRTRFSFTSAADLLGLQVIDFDEKKTQIAHGETVRETMNMISFMTEVIGIRDDMFIGLGDSYMRQVGEALDDGYQHGVLPQRPTIINLQSDIDHPTQTMADLLHLIDYFGGLDNLKGKKIAVTWAYSPSYGKPLSVPQGIIGLMTRLGMHVVLAHPEGYDLMPEVIDLAKNQAKLYGSKFEIVNSMDEAFRDADIIYPKSWAPFWVMQERTKLIKAGDDKGLDELEKQALAENAKHMDWVTDEKRVALTKDGKALYMHPLPADISGLNCEHGEVTNEIFERYRIQTYKQASWKPYAIASMILNSKFKDIVAVVENIFASNRRRVKYGNF